MAAAADPTLDELRLILAPQIVDAAAFDGWGKVALENAAEAHGIAPEVAALAYPGGAMDMIATWFECVDAAMIKALPADMLAALPVRERIRRLVAFRLEAVRGKEEAVRRAQAVMAMPQNAARALRLGWRSADAMWRLAGDTASDFNHYTKRALLGGIYATTLAVWVNDKSPGKAASHAFLERRIGDVMRFEKAKARLLSSRDRRFSMARLLGRLRYPAR